MTRALPRFLLAGAALLSSLACGPQPDDLPKPSSTAAQVTTDFHAVVPIRTGNVGLSWFTCTGTMIGPRAVLTASKCLDEASYFYVGTPKGTMIALAAATSKNPDLALIQLEADGADPGDIIPLGSEVDVGDITTLVGFDNPEQDTLNWMKKSGTNQVFAWNGPTEAELLLLTPPAASACPDNRAGACLGAASFGGPMLTGGPGSSRVVAVLRGQAEYPDSPETLASIYMNVTEPAARDFLKRASQAMQLQINGL